MLGSSDAHACARPTSPGGFAGYQYGAASVRTLDSTRVRAHYTLEGPHAVNPASSRADAVPDDVARVTEVAEEALSYFAQLGYRAPGSDVDATCAEDGGDARLDIYLVAFGGADGQAATQNCRIEQGVRRCATFVLIERDFARRYRSAFEGIRTVVPHELFHAVQNAYDADVDRFFAEGTAQWVTKRLYPDLGDFERNLPAFFQERGRALDAPPGGVTSGYLYGAGVWPLFLELTRGTSFMRDILEREAISRGSNLEKTREALADAARTPATFGETLAQFGAFLAATGPRAGTGGFPDAARYPTAPVSEFQEELDGVSSGAAVFLYRATFEKRAHLDLFSTRSVHHGVWVPLVDGKARVDRTKPLPENLQGEGIIVVASDDLGRADAPFRLELHPIEDPPPDDPQRPPETPTTSSRGGCAAGASDPGWGSLAYALLLFGATCFFYRRAKPHRPDFNPRTKP
jgi:hypothetical protein